MSQPSSQLLESIVGGKYRLTAVLSEGGGDTVFEAEHLLIKRNYAIRLLNGFATSEPMARMQFQQDTDLASKLLHPSLLPLVDSGFFSDGRPFIVYDLADGRTLSQIIATDGAMPIKRAFQLFMGMVSAVACMHDRGLVHGRLSAANIRVVESNGVEKAVVMDIARPEFCRDRPKTYDVKALGGLLYAMLVGKPLAGPEATTVSRLGKAMPNWLLRILHRCLVDEYGFADAAELHRELMNHAKEHDEQTPTEPMRVISMPVSSKGLWLVILVALVLLAVTVAAFFWLEGAPKPTAVNQNRTGAPNLTPLPEPPREAEDGAADDGRSAADIAQEADEMYEQMQYGEALPLYDKLLELAAADKSLGAADILDWREKRAMCYFSIADYPTAVEEYQQLLQEALAAKHGADEIIRLRFMVASGALCEDDLDLAEKQIMSTRAEKNRRLKEDFSRQTQFPSLSQVEAAQGYLREKQGREVEAVRLYRKALADNLSFSAMTPSAQVMTLQHLSMLLRDRKYAREVVELCQRAESLIVEDPRLAAPFGKSVSELKARAQANMGR